MGWRLIAWIITCLLLGKGIVWAFAPADIFYSAAAFIVPFIIFGFQYRLLEQATRSVIGMPLYSEGFNFKQLTFWGIPISSSKLVTGSSKLIHHYHMTPTPYTTPFFPAVLNRLLNGR